MNRVVVPPLKSQGIKTKLVPWIKNLAPSVSGRWIEPFLGTGVVAINSGFSRALLNDANPHIVRFYSGIQAGEITPESVRNYLEFEGKALSEAGADGYDHYNFIKDRFNRVHAPLDFLFLSRAGFNGMMRFNKRGNWNIPFCKKPKRFSKSYITKIVNQVRDVAIIIADEWHFVCGPFQDTIENAVSDDFIYCDPPYYGRYVDYYNGWTEEDEKELADLLEKTPARFILSTWHHNDYRENEMIEKYWSNFNIVTRDHFYHSGGKIENRKSIVEALVFNFDTTIERHNHGVVERPQQLFILDR